MSLKKMYFSALLMCCSLLSANAADIPVSETNESSASQIQTNLEIVNINQASADEIEIKLKGIGMKKAEAIVEYRKKNGKFNSIEDLLHVKGIGEATLEKNQMKIQL